MSDTFPCYRFFFHSRIFRQVFNFSALLSCWVRLWFRNDFSPPTQVTSHLPELMSSVFDIASWWKQSIFIKLEFVKKTKKKKKEVNKNKQKWNLFAPMCKLLKYVFRCIFIPNCSVNDFGFFISFCYWLY